MIVKEQNVILIRGACKCGKSTLAKKLLQEHLDCYKGAHYMTMNGILPSQTLDLLRDRPVDAPPAFVLIDDVTLDLVETEPFKTLVKSSATLNVVVCILVSQDFRMPRCITDCVTHIFRSSHSSLIFYSFYSYNTRDPLAVIEHIRVNIKV